MLARTVLLVGVTLAFGAGPAEARRWIVKVGARTSASPPYEGADHSVIRGSPTLSIAPATEFHRFDPPGDGTTFALIDTRRVTIGPMARFQRTREDEGELAGFDKVKRAVEPGAFINIWPTDWLRARVEVRRGVTGHKGWVGDAGIDLVYSGGRWDASLGPRVGFGDDRYMRTYFGVTPLEAARSPLIDAAYAPEGGRRYTGVQAGLAYHIDNRWTATLEAGYRRLSRTAARSPIVQATGSRDQYSAGIGITYSFGFGR